VSHPAFLTELLLVLIAATLVAIIFERLRLPAILGYLLSGVIIGPQGLRILANTDRIHQMAEIGVVLLMFTIGLEFTVDRLRGLKKIAFLGGALQLLISIGISLLFAWKRGWSVFSGFCPEGRYCFDKRVTRYAYGARGGGDTFR